MSADLRGSRAPSHTRPTLNFQGASSTLRMRSHEQPRSQTVGSESAAVGCRGCELAEGRSRRDSEILDGRARV